MRLQPRLHANFLQGLAIAVLSFFKGLEQKGGNFLGPSANPAEVARAQDRRPANGS
jgi:hypothetical protein